MQESSLINRPDGDRDSIGLFQQRPSQGWGSAAQVHDPRYASRQFYTKLLKVPRWQRLPLTVAAQAVQGSAYPNAYAKHEPLATRIVVAVATNICSAASAFGLRVVAFGKRLLGTPYAWGAGGYNGPTSGHIDCSGLTMYAIYQASNGRIRLPHLAGAQLPMGTQITRAQAAPGDLIFFYTPGNPTSRRHHVGIYVGNNQILHAPDVGQDVKIEELWRTRDRLDFVRYG